MVSLPVDYFVESGMLPYLFDSDYKQRRDLIAHKDAINHLKTSIRLKSQDLEVRVAQLENENSEIKLVCLTLLRTLINHGLIDQEGFIQLAQQVNVEVGQQHEGILPKPEIPQKPQIKIDFSSARQKPKSLNS